MENVVFLEAYENEEDGKAFKLTLPLESFITYSIYTYCSPDDVRIRFVMTSRDGNEEIVISTKNKVEIVESVDVPWQVSSCIYPVVLYQDTIITGLCAVARHIAKYRSTPPSAKEHEEGLLGFRKNCLQAPNAVSVWTKFCEVDITKTVKDILKSNNIRELPKVLVSFENHLGKPVRIHNVYKIAVNNKKESLKKVNESKPECEEGQRVIQNDKGESIRVGKPRKWKSNAKKEMQINCSTKITDLNINHEFAEGPFLTLADLVLLPSYHILMNCFGSSTIESLLPLTYKWFLNLNSVPELKTLREFIGTVKSKPLITEGLSVPITDGVSLYKRDPSRHNPKKRLFTKEEDIENALSCITNRTELDIKPHSFDKINWDSIPDGANPILDHLPDKRVDRKFEQLENLALAVLSIAKDGDLIVDFCSGSGHLGILIAYLLPKCKVILIENKEQSLQRARNRVHEMKLKNVLFFQCNLDFYVGKFDIGIALHACGVASDLVLDKCLKAKAKFVICPCCYGSLHSTERLFPRSSKFPGLNDEQFICILHAADQTHENHPLAVRGAQCMAVIDLERAQLAKEFGYKVTLTRLKPLTCTPKNNLLIGVPS